MGAQGLRSECSHKQGGSSMAFMTVSEVTQCYLGLTSLVMIFLLLFCFYRFKGREHRSYLLMGRMAENMRSSFKTT
jgi:hypothetical protein